MAVAVKNMPEITTYPARPMDRLPVTSLLGTGYVLAGIAAVFYLLPAVFWDWLHLARTPAIGIGITIAVGIVLLAVAGWYFFHPTFKRWLLILEEQGWFDIAAYKKSQGQRVRRGTILGIIALA